MSLLNSGLKPKEYAEYKLKYLQQELQAIKNIMNIITVKLANTINQSRRIM